MNITILTSAAPHPVHAHLETWKRKHEKTHKINIIKSVSEAPGGDVLFMISCPEIVTKETRDLYRHSLVVHAAALPQGRGWSPHIWQILEGNNDITVTLLEAEDKVDSGRIWLQKTMHLEGHELYDEINEKLFETTLKLMDEGINSESAITPTPQSEDGASYYSRRTPEDSKIDINLPLSTQFDLLRIVDPDRFPAFFDHRGHRYRIRIEKMENKK